MGEIKVTGAAVKKILTREEVGEQLFDDTYTAYLDEQVELDVLRSIRAGGMSAYNESTAKKKAMDAKRAKDRFFKKMSDRVLELLGDSSIPLEQVQWAVNDTDGVLNVTINT